MQIRRLCQYIVDRKRKVIRRDARKKLMTFWDYQHLLKVKSDVEDEVLVGHDHEDFVLGLTSQDLKSYSSIVN